MARFLRGVLFCLVFGLAACAGVPEPGAPGRGASSGRADDVAIFALGLQDTGYRFGGKNPDAGFDCSGMVSYVFERAAGLRLSGSAADLARLGRPVALAEARPGDLVFFNTLNRPYSHVGIFIGGGRFVHAPSRRGQVRTDSLNDGWFSSRFEEVRRYFD